jgi:pimeloyl-ACP methyl ester carboxylesterase
VLEHRWSEGALWSLLPKSAVPLQLHIRVGENFQTRAIRAEGERVLVIWLPHAAGTDTGSEVVARLVTARGWAVASLLPPPDLPRPGAELEDWVALVEERIRAGREAVHVTADEQTQCTVLMGVSVGGISALRAAELEDRVDAVVALLAGTGAEGLLHAARAYGAADGAPSAELSLRLNALDPAAHAIALGARPVLLVDAMFDSVIPRGAFEALRTALDEPAVQAYPAGHESFAYVLPLAVDRALDWAARACDGRKQTLPLR